MISALALSLVLAQAEPTQAQAIGAVNTIVAAYQDRANRTKNFNANHTRVCVGPATGSTLTGRTTIRFGVLILSQAAQSMLTMPSPSGEAYGAAEVQIDPAQPTDHLIIPLSTLNGIVQALPAKITVRASPLVSTAEVCLVRRDTPEIAANALFRCACWDGANSCTWARPNSDGTTTNVACPKGLTLSPGSWSGTGAVPKPCVTRFDGFGVDASWPASCPK